MPGHSEKSLFPSLSGTEFSPRPAECYSVTVFTMSPILNPDPETTAQTAD